MKVNVTVRVIVLTFITVVIGAAVVNDLGEKGTLRTDHPPHRQAERASATFANHLTLDGEAIGWIAAELAWYEGVNRAEWEAGVERARTEEAERLAATRRVADSTVARNGTRVACDGLALPEYIVWRESNCTRGIDTGNGYYGAYQVAAFHWFGGICDGLSWLVPEQEDECARRLSQDGTTLRPWGG